MSEDPVEYEMDQTDVVAAALSKARMKEYGTDWNYDVARRFAKAAIEAGGSRPAPQIKIEALRAAAAIVVAQTKAGTGFIWCGKNVTVGAFTIALSEQFEGYMAGEIGTDLPKAMS